MCKLAVLAEQNSKSSLLRNKIDIRDLVLQSYYTAGIWNTNRKPKAIF